MLSDDINNIGRCKDAFMEQVPDAFGQSICETAFDASMDCVTLMEAARIEAEMKRTSIKLLLAEIRLMI